MFYVIKYMLLALITQPMDVASKTILYIFLTAFILVIIYFIFKTIEVVYIMFARKPFFVHFYFILKKLPPTQMHVLENNFSFYNKLSQRKKKYFQHRVASFINDKHFIGREGLLVTDEMKVLIASTAVMLTFGFRDYFIGLIDKIFIYPDQFYSTMNDAHHKGEFNPQLRAMVLSWKHFRSGYDNEKDNLNLGIHEFTHAIHLNSIKEHDISSNLFQDSFQELILLISTEKDLREKLIESGYFREYAYTNQYEFIAAIVESFVESPIELGSNFPQVYGKVKQMLNFNFAGY